MCEENKNSEALYSTIVNVRNTELAAYWTRYNIQAVLNIAVLGAALTSSTEYSRKHIITGVIAGLVLSSIWLYFVIKGKELLTKRWDLYIIDYEKRLKYDLFTKVYADEKKKGPHKKRWDNLDYLARSLPFLCMVAWLYILAQVG